MKNKASIIVSLLVIAIIGILLAARFVGVRPFKEISEDEIARVSVELLPPGEVLELSESDISALVEILRTVTIYRKDDSYGEYNGQAVIYTITRTDGSETIINNCNPFLIVDGVGYRTKYGPSEELSRLGNEILEREN